MTGQPVLVADIKPAAGDHRVRPAWAAKIFEGKTTVFAIRLRCRFGQRHLYQSSITGVGLDYPSPFTPRFFQELPNGGQESVVVGGLLEEKRRASYWPAQCWPRTGMTTPKSYFEWHSTRCCQHQAGCARGWAERAPRDQSRKGRTQSCGSLLSPTTDDRRLLPR